MEPPRGEAPRKQRDFFRDFCCFLVGVSVRISKSPDYRNTLKWNDRGAKRWGDTKVRNFPFFEIQGTKCPKLCVFHSMISFLANNSRFSLSRSHCSQPNVLVRHTMSQLTHLFKGQPENTWKLTRNHLLKRWDHLAKMQFADFQHLALYFSNVDLWPV